ncbi:phosphotransferase family protein [Paenibacillus ginsengarvi]|uniref:Aminoglycoside phosphotransferase family protein n=1 Tax=Paenibacillus ginsengarvi TaxID=400777 RepID=A0A3B0CJ39_9BACL|nr:aminoglycoside phosphotransferase family protein [Paenibacillus ginsengarvi]RKN85212.1 aminoglycoside phosphotransferase family protein [Paenibacillus ginsengarvi]
MSEFRYRVNFEALCEKLQLGQLTGTPKALQGGLLHRMFAVQTSLGKYAVKALNPEIMSRPTAMPNMIRSEQIAHIAAAGGIPALPAKRFGGASLQCLDDQFYLVFDWLEGRCLKPHEIRSTHCEIMGAIFADLHRTDFSELGITKREAAPIQPTDWSSYARQGRANRSVWADMLLDTMDQLYEWKEKAIRAAQLLAEDNVISHGDLDSKNVMWNGEKPVLIDWEASGAIHPMQNLTETALYWSETESGDLDCERLFAFLSAYRRRFGPFDADWPIVLDYSLLGLLGWLEYSLKRSLWINCTDEEEQRLGTEQVSATIASIKRNADRMPEVARLLRATGGLNEQLFATGYGRK